MSHTDKTAPYSISHQSPRRKVVREECKRFTRQERRRLKVWLRQSEQQQQVPDPIRRPYRNGYCDQGCCY